MNGAGRQSMITQLAPRRRDDGSVARYIQEGQFGCARDGRASTISSPPASAKDWLWRVTRRASSTSHSRIAAVRHPRAAIACVCGHGSHRPGYDIIHEHTPTATARRWVKRHYTDFLVFAAGVTQLQGGVLLNYGTAIMGPEVYSKRFRCAPTNASTTRRAPIKEFTTPCLTCQDLGPDLRHEAAKTDARYSLSPVQTILVRTVAGRRPELFTFAGTASRDIAGALVSRLTEPLMADRT